jgi:hypothetical protein
MSAAQNETLRERLACVLGAPLITQLEGVAWRWPNSDRLGQPGPIDSPELVAWIWGKLLVSGCPFLKQLVLLSQLFPEPSEEHAAFIELHQQITEGMPMFGADRPLLWERAPTLSPLAEYWKMVATNEASIDMATTVFSFCPWADEYSQAHSSIKEWMKIHAWSKACWNS